MLPDIADIKREDKPYNYEIDFYYKDRVYERSVELFGLKERYNNDYLMDALRLLDAKDRLTPKSVADAAAIFGMTSEEFATRFLKEEKVALVPGTAFGECGEGYLRISYAYSLDNLKIALSRLERFVKKLREERKL